MKSWKTPTPDQVSRAVALIPRAGQYRYFFDQLNNPEWIAPLKERGFFQQPPPPLRDEEEGSVTYPPWPESRYLSRMASLNAEQVLETALNIPDTENVRVYEDIADAALQMPSELAACLVPKLITGLQSPHTLLLPEKLGALIEYLSREGQVDVALRLARELLPVRPDPRADEQTIEYKSEVIRLHNTPRAPFEQWEYSRIIRKNIPALVTAAGQPAFLLLCEILDSAIDLYTNQRASSAIEDYSNIWFPAIEDDEDSSEVHALLVSAVRDAAESLIRDGLSSVEDIVWVLDQQRWAIFKRLSLHILRRFGRDSLSLVEEKLIDKSLFDSATIRREYALLERDYFSLISERGQAAILSWIEAGPDLERFRIREQQWRGVSPSEEEIEKYSQYWRRERLTPLRNSLPDDWKQTYDGLVASVGEPENPDFLPARSEVWTGPTSPLSAEELRSMAVDEIAAFISSWVPSGDLMTPTPEGLSRDLRGIVSSDPQRFSEGLDRIRGLDPTYIRGLLGGFHEAAKQKRSFDWQSVLTLCEWVLEQPRQIQGRVEEEDIDPDWSWTRQTIAELLSSAFDSGDIELPFDMRDRAWRLLQILTEDPSPTPEDDSKFSSDPLTHSLNTVRGEAMHAVFRYALWVRRQIEKVEDGEERLAKGFDEMPEVRDVLDTHLDLDRDSSPAIRSVYGQWFPWASLLDNEWARESIPRIFPKDEELQSYRAAAWSAYLFNRPYDDVFDLLREEYAFAVNQMAADEMRNLRRFNPEERIAEHIILLYWRGKIGLDDTLIQSFFSVASEDRRGRAISYIGRGLSNKEVTVSQEALDRLRALWLWRFSEARAAESVTPYTKELAAFSWWFASTRFDDAWAIDELKGVLQSGIRIDPYSGVVERLADLAAEMPGPVIECVTRMVDALHEDWHIIAWRDDLRRILSAVINSPDLAARGAARNLINNLGRRNFLEYRDLLT